MEVYEPGTKILIQTDIAGYIDQVLVTRTGNVLYKCIWWNGKDRKEDWLHPDEFTVEIKNTIPIGFIKT